MILKATLIWSGCCTGGGLLLARALQASPEPAERYTILGVLVLVLGGVFKVMNDTKNAQVQHAVAIADLSATLRESNAQNQEAHRTYASERDKAVAAVKESVAGIKTHVDTRAEQLLEKIENTCGGGAA